MICDWRYEDQTDLSDNDISVDISLANNGNDRGEVSELTRRRKSWANSSIASEDGESVLWKRVDYQLELLSAMDESDRKETHSPLHPIMTDPVSPQVDEKPDEVHTLQTTNNTFEENSVKSSVEKHAISHQRIPSTISDDSYGRENRCVISTRRAKSLPEEQLRCPPSNATEILAVVGAQRERRKSLTVGRRASVDVNQLMRLMNETKNASSPANDNVNITDNGNPLTLDKVHKTSDSDEEINDFLLPHEGEPHSSSVCWKASTAPEICAVAEAQRERRKSLTVGRRASVNVNQLMRLMNETKNVSSPANDNVNVADNGNPLSLDKEHKISDSDVEESKILLPYDGEPRSSSLCSKERDDTTHTSSTRDGFARGGATRERRKSIADCVRASLIVHQILGIQDGKNKVHPNNDGLQIVEVEKDIDSEEEVSRFLESITSPHPSPPPENQDCTSCSDTAPVHKGRRVNFENTVSKAFTDEELSSPPRSHGSTAKDLNEVNPTVMKYSLSQTQSDEAADRDQVESKIEFASKFQKKNSDKRTSRKKKIKKSISRSEQVDDSELSCEQILSSVAAQRERRKHVVQKKHDRNKGRISFLIERKEEHVPHIDVMTEGDDEEEGSQDVNRTAAASSNESSRKCDIHPRTKDFYETVNSENMKEEPTPIIEAEILAAVASQREKRRDVIQNIRKSSEVRSLRRSSLNYSCASMENLTPNLSSEVPHSTYNLSSQGINYDSSKGTYREVSSDEMASIEIQQQNHADIHGSAVTKIFGSNAANSLKEIRDGHCIVESSDASTNSYENLQPSSSPKTSKSADHARPSVVTAAQLMMCALASRSDRSLRDGVSSQKNAFSHFSLLSVPASHLLSLASNEQKVIDAGSSFLDPFIIKSAQVIDQYPLENSSKEGFLPSEALSTFCVPNGILVRFIPRFAVAGAKRLGWYGENSERYQLHSFTDEKGDLSYGISIITCEELSCEKALTTEILAEFRFRRRKRWAGRIITRWCFEMLHNKHGTYEWGSDQGRGNENRHSWQSLGNDGPAVHGRPNLMRNIRKLGSLVSSSFSTETSVHSGAHSTSNGRKLRSQSAKLNPSSVSISLERHGSSRSCSSAIEGYTESVRQNNRNSHATSAAASQAYRYIAEAERLGEICVIERCYVLVGTKSTDHALLFYALQQLIDIEREQKQDLAIQQLLANNSSATTQRQAGLRRLSFGISGMLSRESPQRRTNSHKVTFSAEHRHAIISYMQKKLMLSPQQASINSSLSKGQQHVASQQATFHFNLPFSVSGQTVVKLPLPNVTLEWGLALLLLNIKISALLVVLKLLLLERSVLVIGRNFEEVTVIASALRDLLDPFIWASAFMPLLPIDMIDFVSAPVPFIAGVVVKSEKNLHDFERDVRVKDALSSGLSIVNLWRKKVRVTSEPEIAELVGNTGGASSKLLCYQKRLEDLSACKGSALMSFRTFFSRGLSFRERLTLQSMRNAIKEVLINLTRISTETPDDWSPFGEHDETGCFFDFSSAKFVESVMFKMLAQFKYLEIMSQTQLFIGYVDNNMHQTLEHSRQLRGAEANFIALWLKFRWGRYRERKQLGAQQNEVIHGPYTQLVR